MNMDDNDIQVSDAVARFSFFGNLIEIASRSL